MSRFLAVIAQFAVIIAVIFIIGQAAVIPIQNTMLDQESHNITGKDGEVILEGESWMNRGQRLIFQWLPQMIMIGIPAIAFMYYLRLTQVKRGGPGGGF